MTEFDKARREILAALLLEYHRTVGELTDYEDLKDKYPLRTRKDWFDPIISEIEEQLIVSRTLDGVSARIHPRGYGYILREILNNLSGTLLEIDSRKEEILSDASDYEWFPMPAGWKWFHVGDESGDRDTVTLRDSVTAELVPASDRLVPLDHNSAPYQQVKDGLAELYQELRAANDLDCEPAERDRILASLTAAQSLWDAAQLKIIQIKVGIIITIEDAVSLLTKAGKAVGKALLVDTIRSIVKHKTGIDL